VADDHVVVRKGLRALLEAQTEWDVVAEACDGRETIEMARIFQPDLIILDITMPQWAGCNSAHFEGFSLNPRPGFEHA